MKIVQKQERYTVNVRHLNFSMFAEMASMFAEMAVQERSVGGHQLSTN
jgi:hypothetical protein